MSPSDRVDAVVVGAGVVGLAVARALALRGLEVVVLERHRRIGEETSSRNSGVIHSGIYYATGSAKARFCVRGRALLYDYCAAKGIAHRRCGKVIVGQHADVERLRALETRARANGVDDLEWLDAGQLQALEPQVRGTGALWCPSTGIIDVHELLTALHGDVEQHGGSVVFDAEFLGARPATSGMHVTLRSGSSASELDCAWLINAAGLQALDALGRIDGYPHARTPQRFYAKGNYFDYRGPAPFTHLVYPMPADAGLGVHATLDLAGRVRFGPDVQWIDALDYQVDPARAAQFYPAIREYWPSLPDGALSPAYAGIRPKLVGPGAPAADFLIETPRQHGVAGLVNLLGIESPGLTSSLAIGEYVAALL